MAKQQHPTPMLDELEKGPWPSFVTGLKRLAADKDYVVDVLGQPRAHRRIGERSRKEAARRREPAIGGRLEEARELQPGDQRRHRRLRLEPQQPADRRVGRQCPVARVIILQRLEVGTIVRHGATITNDRSSVKPLRQERQIPACPA